MYCVYSYMHVDVCECTSMCMHMCAYTYTCVYKLDSHYVLFKSPVFGNPAGFAGCCPFLPRWDPSGYTDSRACLLIFC